MSSLKIVCDDKIPFLKGVFEPYADVVYLPGAEISSEDVRDADALIIRTRTICNRSLLEGSRLKIIASATIGYDHIDTDYCARNGILWTNAPGCNSASVAQYIGSVLLHLFERFEFKTLGIVGVGNVGSKVNILAQEMGLRTILNDPPKGIGVSLNELIEASDIITLHTPLTVQTRHLIDPLLLKDKILINSSRGPVVDNQALKQALKERVLRAAVLDVWENEPQIDTELLDLLEIGTPHIAGYSIEGKANGTTAAIRAVSKALNLPLNEYTCHCETFRSWQSLENSIVRSDEAISQLRQSYSVKDDDLRLRTNPLEFEKLRGNYPTRHEPSFFQELFREKVM